MKKCSRNSTRAAALQIAFTIALLSGGLVLATTAASGSNRTKASLLRGPALELVRKAEKAWSTVPSASKRLFNSRQEQAVAQEENVTTPDDLGPAVGFAPAAVQSVITVTSLDDGHPDATNCPGPGCRLRDAIAKSAAT